MEVCFKDCGVLVSTVLDWQDWRLKRASLVNLKAIDLELEHQHFLNNFSATYHDAVHCTSPENCGFELQDTAYGPHAVYISY